jgi:pimeloyl-ACP methyl ester carboxylesterase
LISTLHYRSPSDSPERILLVMLPGYGIEAEEFAGRGLVASLQSRGWPVDVVAPSLAPDLYLDGSVAAPIHRDIVEPAWRQGYRRIWLLGISLGCMGALLYANQHADIIEGIILLAPFLGTQGSIAELAQMGGFGAWSSAHRAPDSVEGQMLGWLQRHLTARAGRPVLYLGYGDFDRFAAGHKLLAACLPEEKVLTAEGGHDWETWLLLWNKLLDALPFGKAAGLQ